MTDKHTPTPKVMSRRDRIERFYDMSRADIGRVRVDSSASVHGGAFGLYEMCKSLDNAHDALVEQMNIAAGPVCDYFCVYDEDIHGMLHGKECVRFRAALSQAEEAGK